MRRMLLGLSPFAAIAILAGCSPVKPFTAAFDVSVTFTPAAMEKLKGAGAQAVVDVLYSGIPTEANREKVNETGQIELGEDLVTFEPASKTVHVTGNGFDLQHLDAIQNRKVMVNIRGYSDTSHRETLIQCASLTMALSAAQAKPQTLSCDAA